MIFNKLFILAFLILSLNACQHQVSSLQQSLNPVIQVDYLIRNGDVFTGRNIQAKQLNIGICQQLICYIDEKSAKNINAKHIIDASGLIITPGFIDPHTHSLEELLSDNNNSNANYLTQGVTTVITGNDGDGSYEITKLSNQLIQNTIGTNVALLVGHNAIRTAVIGKTNRPPTSTELTAMKQLLRQALTEGALGFSSGLYYVPGIYSKTEEVIELAKVAAEFDVLYESHIRDESSFSIGFIAAIKEFIEIIEAAQIQGHIAHIKALGVDVWGQSNQVIDLINQANERGLTITADQYPWQASGTFLHNAVIPKWVLEGERAQVLKQLSEPAHQAQLLNEITENIRKRGGPNTLLITASSNHDWLGKYLSEIARTNQTSAEQMVLNMMQKEETRIASFNMSAVDINNFMQQDWVVTSSDGTNGHPRKYASFPTKFEQYVVKQQSISLSQFVNNSSTKTAEIFGMKNRGSIEVGMQADINIIDLKEFKAHADFSAWNKISTGIVHQFVNGMLSIENYKLTELKQGQVILRDLCISLGL